MRLADRRRRTVASIPLADANSGLAAEAPPVPASLLTIHHELPPDHPEHERAHRPRAPRLTRASETHSDYFPSCFSQDRTQIAYARCPGKHPRDRRRRATRPHAYPARSGQLSNPGRLVTRRDAIRALLRTRTMRVRSREREPEPISTFCFDSHSHQGTRVANAGAAEHVE